MELLLSPNWIFRRKEPYHVRRRSPQDDRAIDYAIGSKEKCLSLGFLVKDDNATMYLSSAGLGYLLDVVAGDVCALPDAYAAGYKQGQTHAKEGF